MPTRYVQHNWENDSLETPFSAARLTETEDGVYDAHVKPRGSIFATTVPTVANNTVVEPGTTTGFTSMTFTDEYDSEGWHPGASMNPGNVRIGLYGLYLFTAHVDWTANATGTRYCTIAYNGGAIYEAVRDKAAGSNTHNQSSSLLLYCNVGDRIGAYLYQTSGGTLLPLTLRLTWTLISYG